MIADKINLLSKTDSNHLLYTSILQAVEQYLQALNIDEAIILLYEKLCTSSLNDTQQAFSKAIQYLITLIDQKLTQQINVILHKTQFQQLEASWRGLLYLVEDCDPTALLKIKILDLNWDTLAKDLNYALEFDQSQLFKKIYSTEFDQPGGEPFGLLIGDYQISQRSWSKDGISHIETLQAISKIAAAAFAPFVCAASPSLLGLNHFSELEPWMDLSHIFQQEEYRMVRSLFADEDVRFIGLVLPLVLMRKVYHKNQFKRKAFIFEEKISDSRDYLWGNAAYCFASIIIRAYNLTGWFSDIRGIEQNSLSKGLVGNLLQESYQLDRLNVFAKPVTNCSISSKQERALNKSGLIALCNCKYTPYAAFFSARSIQHARSYQSNQATENAEISSMFQHILCVSRFAHYIKIMMREKIGKYTTALECQSYLQQWILRYTADIDNISPENRVLYPLRAAQISIREQQGKPGSYIGIMHFQPHLQVDELAFNFALTTHLII